MSTTSKRSAPVLAAFAVAAGLLLPSTALAQKSVFVRSKPHVNVGVEAGGPNKLVLPAQHGPEIPTTNAPHPLGASKSSARR